MTAVTTVTAQSATAKLTESDQICPVATCCTAGLGLRRGQGALIVTICELEAASTVRVVYHNDKGTVPPQQEAAVTLTLSHVRAES